MTRNKIQLCLIAAATLTLSHSALAHHSHGNYLVNEKITIQGTVTEAHLANPHVWIFMDVTGQSDESRNTNWAIESGGLNSFKRKGWDGLSVGDKLSITCAPTRDDSNGCFLRELEVIENDETSGDGSSWTNMVFEEQHFSANFPNKPKVRTEPYESEYGGVFPSTIYESNVGDSRYSVTVIDFSDAKDIYEELAKTSKIAGGSHNYWSYTQLGSVQFEATKIRQMGGSVDYDAWHLIDGIEGHQIFTSYPKEDRRSYTGLYRHADRLFKLTADVPMNAPPPGVFQQSLTVLDEEGGRVRYDLSPDHSRIRQVIIKE